MCGPDAVCVRAFLEKDTKAVMKYFIASDIHGSAHYCQKVIERYAAEKADRLILLGDILYHGPRNDLPEEYDPKEVSRMLNELADEIICVRGNCEAEVDQMMLSFPVMAEYALLEMGGKLIYLTHGHIYGADNPPPMKKGDILLNGHTHIPACEEREGYMYMNPGSVSIPKEDSPHSYMTLEDGVFLWKNLGDGEVFMEYGVNGR